MRKKRAKTRSVSKKRSKSSKPKLKSIKSLRARLWNLCKQITRKRYVREDGTWACYTCGKKIDVPKKAHTGHCINSHYCGIRLRYDLRNLRVQDYYCNINLGSNGAVYLNKLTKEIGQEEIDDMFRLLDMKDEPVNEREFIENLIKEYELILSRL